MQSETTTQTFKTEEEACRFFNQKIIDSDLFRMYEEVNGKIVFHRHWKEDKRNLRIDRILFPKERLIKDGWKLGIIGVEIKNSGLKIGPPLAQSIDYLDAVWFVTSAELAIHLSHVFLFPLGELHNNMASVCAQSHLGQFEITPRYIRIKTGESTLFYYDFASETIQCAENKNGKRIGSR